MNFADARELLARVAVLDNRTVDATTIQLWQEVLSDVTLPEAMFALREWARDETDDYLRPAHLIAIIRQKREEYRMINPSGHLEKDSWLSLERQHAVAADYVKAVRATGQRTAVEAIESGDFDGNL